MKALHSLTLVLSFAACFLALLLASHGPFHPIMPIASLVGLFGVFFSISQLAKD